MIVVALSTPKKFHLSSWLIRLGTGFPASHASLHIKGRGLFEGERMVFEATAHGIGLVHPSRWDAENKVIQAFEMVKEQDAGRAAFRDMWSHLGADYDWAGAFHFALRVIVAHLYNVKIEAPDTPTTMFCSELVARWLNGVKTQLGLPLGTLHPDEVSPAGLSAELKQSELFEVIPCELSLSAIFT